MTQVSTNDLKNGMGLDLPEGLYTVVEFQHVKPGKGGAFVRTWQPSSVTTTVSSIRTPPCSARYTPGSTVTTWPAASTSVELDATRGASWISNPTP